MKVHSAIMLDEEEVADHNCPTLILASSEEALLTKVREHVKDHSWWMDAMHVDAATVDTLSINDMNERLCGGDGEGGDRDEDDYDNDANLFIHSSEEEV